MTKPLTLPLGLDLSYSHSLGDLSPYFEGLLTGRAIGSRCKKCGKAWCPPALNCPHDGEATICSELAGTGTLLSATETTTALPLAREPGTHIFGLVRLDGAENAMFARLSLDRSEAIAGKRLRLQRATGEWPHPAQAAVFVSADP